MEFISDNYSVDINYVQDLVQKYGIMGAAKLLSESLDKNVDNTYVAGTLYALHLQRNAVDIRLLHEEKPYLFNDFVNKFILAHYDLLKNVLVHERDYGFQFASVKTIAKNYLFKYKGEPIESIQWAWMRIAIQVAAPDNWMPLYEKWTKECVEYKDYLNDPVPEYLQEVLHTYEIFSQREGIHATPTCINAGYCNPQLESCFLARIGDNMLSIADVQKLLLMGSKCNGGFGVFMGDIRHSRVANRGITKGVPGLAKVINGLVPYADQLGSRPMAVTLFLPVWHCDILTFIRMKDENAPLDIKASLLNYCVCIPDLFRKRCLEGTHTSDPKGTQDYRGYWSLFCPRECKMQWVREHGGNPDNTHEVDAAPSLCDVWGKEFEEYYLMCERAGIVKQVIKARDLDAGIHTYRCMIGEPYIFYTDNVNRKSNHQNIGTVVQSNLCTEILQTTTTSDSTHGEMVATCDLATINVASLVLYREHTHSQIGDVLPEPYFNWKRLGEITRQFVRNLDRVLDRTSGILPNQGEKEIDNILEGEDIPPVLKELGRQVKKHLQRDPTYNARKKTRSIGIGIMGLASCFALMGYPYGSKESFDLGTRIRACIYYHALDESANLIHEIDSRTGKEKGPYPFFKGSPLSKGILSFDMWKQEGEYMKKYLESIDITPSSVASHNTIGDNDPISLYFKEFSDPEFVSNYKEAMKRFTWKDIDPSSFDVNDTWDNLRKKVEKGVRNSLTTCQMPNSTTSGAFGVSASIEPFYEMYFTADNANGKDTTIYDALRDVFLLHNVYDPEKIASYLYNNKGRINGLHTVFSGDLSDRKSPKYRVKQLETLFPNAFSVNKKKYLLFIQRMGHYIDQAQSTNIFFDKPNAAYLARLSFSNWVNGAKTEYYLRREADTEKIDPFMEENKIASVCKRGGDCVSCQ